MKRVGADLGRGARGKSFCKLHVVITAASFGGTASKRTFLRRSAGVGRGFLRRLS